MKLVFIHGMPGCGKLTVACELSALTDFKLFHNHLTVDLVGSVFEFGSQPFVELRESIWFATFQQAAHAGLEGMIFTFAYDQTVRSNFITQLQTVSTLIGIELRFVGLKCEEQELEERITNVSRERFGKLNQLHVYRELRAAGAFMNPGIPDGFTLDITNIDPPAAAKLIASKLDLSIKAKEERA